MPLARLPRGPPQRPMHGDAAELKGFLDRNHVPQIVSLMIEGLCVDQPTDCVAHMIAWLQQYKMRRDHFLVDTTSQARPAVTPTVVTFMADEHRGVIDDASSEQLRRRYSAVDRRRFAAPPPPPLREAHSAAARVPWPFVSPDGGGSTAPLSVVKVLRVSWGLTGHFDLPPPPPPPPRDCTGCVRSRRAGALGHLVIPCPTRTQ